MNLFGAGKVTTRSSPGVRLTTDDDLHSHSDASGFNEVTIAEVNMQIAG